MDIADRDEFCSWLGKGAEVLHLTLDDFQVDLLYVHLNLLLLANEEFNLTRVTVPAEAAVRLVADSLSLLGWAQTQDALAGPLRVLDMGTGAGYPSIPLAICRPDWRVTAIDTVGKKVRFLGEVVPQLGLRNLQIEQTQAREWHGKVDPFDLVVTRAMGDLSKVVREGARLLKPSGRLVSYHAAQVSHDEQRAADKMLARYKLQQVDSFEYVLPDPREATTRRLIVMGKA